MPITTTPAKSIWSEATTLRFAELSDKNCYVSFVNEPHQSAVKFRLHYSMIYSQRQASNMYEKEITDCHKHIENHVNDILLQCDKGLVVNVNNYATI